MTDSAFRNNTGPTISGVLAIIRLRHTEPSDALFESLVAGGVQVLEVAISTPRAIEAVTRWSLRTEALVGSGTVRTAADASTAVDAGARFLVAPTTTPSVLAVASRAMVPVASGAMTPTEIDRAWRDGAEVVKLFPAKAAGGPEFVKAVREPLHDVPLLPTGGVDVSQTRTYAALGCVGVGVGSALVSESLVADRDWTQLTRRADQFVRAWQEGVAERDG